MTIHFSGTKPFYTKRLCLRRFRVQDAEEMYQVYAKDPQVTKYLRWNPHENVGQTAAFLTSWVKLYKDEKYYHWAVCLKETGELIGAISAFAPEEDTEDENTLEIGYCYGQAFWGKGYGTEAMRGVLCYLTVCGYENFMALYVKENPASGKVMQHVGMKRVGKTTYTKYDGITKVEAIICKANYQDLHL